MMLLIPAAGVPNAYMLQDTLKSAIAALGILTCAITFVLQSNSHAVHWRWSPILWLPLTLSVYALGSVCWSTPYLATVEAIRWLLLSLLTWLSLNVITPKNLPRLMWATHWGATIAAAWVAFQFWFDLKLFPQAAAPASTFINRNFFSEYAVAVIPISVYLLLSLNSSRWLVITAISLALEVTAVLMTGTRSALVVLFIYLPLLVYASLHFRAALTFHSWSRFKCMAIVCTFLASVVTMGNLPSQNVELGVNHTPLTVSSVRTESFAGLANGVDASFSMRLEMWKATARIILEHPLNGVGAGAWEVMVPLYQRIDTGEELDAYAHNEYLQIVSEYGAPVGGLVLAIATASLLLSSMKLSQSKLDPAPAFMAISVAGILLVACVGFPLHLAPCTALLGALTGCIAQKTSVPSAMRVSKKGRQVCLTFALLGLLLWSGFTASAAYVESHFASADAALMQALTHVDRRVGSITTAKQHLAKALEVHPEYPKLLKPIAAELVELGEWSTALNVMEALVDARPYAPDLWFSLAILRAKHNDFRGAEMALAKLDGLQPGALRNEKVRIDLMLRQNQYELADTALKKLESAWPIGVPYDPALTAFSEYINQRPQQKAP